MKKIVLLCLLGISLIANEIITKESMCSVDKTMLNIKGLVEARGLRVFTIVNHQENADLVSLKMPESKLIIFGNPKLGTSFMLEEMQTGLDLPMKILVYKDKDSKVKMAYRNGTWLVKEHKLSISFDESKINKAIDKITDKAGICTND
ncbi:MAG: DUF302 domain-containing protein [Helicobacteraceae bacterium]|nr:DUF302 domain-containing protein [Candidatus Sulfurimonas ponti]MBL6973171.1 DUF302 domain-containing protein [Sulfurimonas sp.]